MDLERCPRLEGFFLACVQVKECAESVSAEMQWLPLYRLNYSNGGTRYFARLESLFSKWRESAKAYTTTLAELFTRSLTTQARAELDLHIAEHCC